MTTVCFPIVFRDNTTVFDHDRDIKLKSIILSKVCGHQTITIQCLKVCEPVWNFLCFCTNMTLKQQNIFTLVLKVGEENLIKQETKISHLAI